MSKKKEKKSNTKTAAFIDTTGLKVEHEEIIKTKRKTFTKKEIEDFWNEPYKLPEEEQIRLDLFYKRRKPQNKEEEEMVRQFEMIKKAGREIDFKGEVF